MAIAVGIFNVDEISRVIKYPGKGMKVATDEYAVAGHGAAGRGGLRCDQRCPERKDLHQSQQAASRRPMAASAMKRRRLFPRACYRAHFLDGDAPYIYPGDILSID
jgi:hypothetical protein